MNSMARILITDDEAAMRDMMGTTLRAIGHTVIEVKSAREALATHRETPVDLIITDLVMKEMDGTELLRRLRTFAPDTPVVAVSGNKHSTIWLNMAKMLGAERILAKPFSPQELVEAVEQLLQTPSRADAAG